MTLTITQIHCFDLVGEANESTIMVEGQEARALLDSGSQLSAI